MNAGRVFELAFAINATTQGNFAAIMANARKSIELLGSATVSTNQKYIQGQKQAADLAKELRRLQGIDTNVQKFKAIQQTMQVEGDKSSRALAAQEKQLAKIKEKLTAAGFSVDRFAESERKLRSEIERTARAEKIASEAQAARARQIEAQRRQNEQYQGLQSRFSDAKAGAMNAIMNIGAAAAPFMGMIRTAANFEAAMSKVKAITDSDNESMKILTETAKSLGATTQFTATQAAEAMSYLGMAGWKAAEITENLPHVLNLAAAGGIDLARAADIVSDDLTAFGLKANETQRMVDVFAYTISNTNTNVEMMGETMKFAAPVAKAYGATLEETAALTGLMANAGIKASQAGTALRSGFLRLAGPPKKAAKEFEELGIDLSDASRQYAEVQATLEAYGIKLDETLPPQKKMVEVIRQLSANTQGLSNEQRLAALSAIFGTNAASGWLNVLDAGPEKLAELVAAIENSNGAAKRMSDTMTDNAKGAATRLTSAIEILSINIGEIFLPALADTADELASLAGSMAEWANENPETIKTVLALGSALLGLYGYLKITALMSAAYQLVMESLNASTIKYVLTSKSFTMTTKIAAAAQWAFNAALAANPVGLVIAGIIALVAAGIYLYNNWAKVKAFMASLWDSPAAAVIAFISGPIGWIIYAAAGLISHWEEVKAWFTLLWNDPSAALEVFVNMVKNKFASMYQYVKEKWEKLKYVLSNPITAAVNFVEHGNVYGSMVHASTGISADEIRGLASGGFVNHPQLTWLAEGGYPEAVIPLDGTARAMELWQQAGASLGVHPVASGAVEASTIEAPIIRSGGGDVNIEFSAPITINGNADNRTVDQIADAAQQMKRQFEDMFRDMMAQQRRVSLA